jgi:NADPH:quinone reductase-like Zn-dependent oxidoreductase
MKTIVRERFGIDAVELREVPKPEIGDDQVLVRVHASSVNPVEWYGVYAPPFMRVMSGQLRRPHRSTLGADLAGTVEAVGKDVTDLRTGDDVFGTSPGSWAEYAAASAARLTRKPASVSFEEAAAVPVAGLTALQALRDHGAVEPGQKVLVNGASGGVGTYTVQIANALGADVTAVCSTRNVDQARSLGANRVVDYTREDFTRLDVRHDLVIDIAGSRSFTKLRRVMKPEGTVIVVGARMRYAVFGPLKHLAGTMVQSIGRSQKAKFFVAQIDTADLAFLGELMETGKIRSVIDRRYGLTEAVEALRYLGEGHAKGKVVIDV